MSIIRMPNLLATRRGRLAAFFWLYVSEAIPLGFTVVAVTAQLRRMGVGPAGIGAFIATLYLPWTFKWIFGPVVDVLRSQRFGHRRAWILLAQSMIMITLLVLAAIPLPESLALFTAVLLVHNSFAALQTVAINGLAVTTLAQDERGLANGLMFAGAAAGNTLGGSGALYLMGITGFHSTFFAVALATLLVTLLVVLPMKEPAVPGTAGDTQFDRPGRVKAAFAEMRDFGWRAFQSFIGTRGAFVAVFFVMLPTGAMALSVVLQSTLAIDLGFTNDQLAQLGVVSSIVSALFMMIGGWLSDRLGRRRMLGSYVVLMSVPTLWLMWQLQRHGYVMVRAPGSAAEPALMHAFWIASIAYGACVGLMLGTRSATIMDVTNPSVAGTQFAAYNAMMNLAMALSATWQGLAVEAWGYPKTLAIDAVLGLVCLLLLPAMRAVSPERLAQGDGHAAARTRACAWGLALLCLAWLPFHHLQDSLGAVRSLFDTLFTLVFIATALFLFAASTRDASRNLARSARWLALLMLAMYARRFVAGWAQSLGLDVSLSTRAAGVFFDAVPLLAAIVLVIASRGKKRTVALESSELTSPVPSPLA